MGPDIHVTVAAVVHRDGRFLLVEEQIDGQLQLNQPAGHLEPDETLVQAVRREAFEETTCRFDPEALVGAYLWQVPGSGRTYLRMAFCGGVGAPDPTAALDTGIERTIWLTRNEIVARQPHWRSPLVLRCVDDYLAGHRYPLDLLVSLLSDA
ncbi:MAG: NUDIX hydrolase [Thiohalobacteraceae bacterium]